MTNAVSPVVPSYNMCSMLARGRARASPTSTGPATYHQRKKLVFTVYTGGVNRQFGGNRDRSLTPDLMVERTALSLWHTGEMPQSPPSTPDSSAAPSPQPQRLLRGAPST